MKHQQIQIHGMPDELHFHIFQDFKKKPAVRRIHGGQGQESDGEERRRQSADEARCAC